MTFADPRDGDLEDDVSSTVRKTLLGHAAGMLVEMSLPKLAIAFTSLILLPALTLGAAPIAVVWYARTVAGNVALGLYLVIAILLAGLAAFVAWRWGLRLLRVVEQNFWSLNAALVQPLYTGLREIVRLVIEAIAPTRSYFQARMAAGLVAGVLIAAGAALLAWRLGPLPTFVVPLGRPGDLWPAAGVAVANGAWAVAVYVMLGAPIWAISEAWAGTPRDMKLGDMVHAGDAAEATWQVAHLSDIHVVGNGYGFRLECGRDGPRGNDRLARTLDLLDAEDRARRLDWILVTGDITDAARNEEFIAFEEAMAAHPGLRERVLVIPGNHDVNIVDRANPSRLELPIAPGGALRRVRMLAATARLQGHRVHVVDRAARRLGATLDAHFAEDGRAALLARFVDRGGIRAAQNVLTIWDSAFPMVVPPPTPDGLGVILLDSNAKTHFSFTNALGLVDGAQLHAAEIAMRQFPAARWLICMHHHLVEYPRPGAPLADRIGTALVNGHWVVGRLRREGPRIVALHGHRHYDWMGTCGGLRILSAPSPVMGGRDEEDRHFWVHGFSPGRDGSLVMAEPRRVVVPGALVMPPPRPSPAKAGEGEGISVPIAIRS